MSLPADTVWQGAVHGVAGAAEVVGGLGQQQPGDLGVEGEPLREVLQAVLDVSELHTGVATVGAGQVGSHLGRDLVQPRPEDQLGLSDEAEAVEGWAVVETLIVRGTLATEVVEPGYLVQLSHHHSVIVSLRQVRSQPLSHLVLPVHSSKLEASHHNVLVGGRRTAILCSPDRVRLQVDYLLPKSSTTSGGFLEQK